MNDFKRTPAGEGISIVSVEANKFKTNELALTFALPLEKESASARALLIRLLASCSKAYPSLTELNKKLALLYGAALTGIASNSGENQTLTLSITSLDDRFSIDEQSISKQALSLLFSLVFEPRLDENGNFFSEDIERERRLLIERLEAEENEKRLYALNRLKQEMFKDEAYSINPNGFIEGVKAVTNTDLLNALKSIKENALIQLTAVGSADTENLKNTVKEYFNSVKRDFIKPVKSEFIPFAKEVKTVEERQTIKQGKLVLGFRVNMESDDERTPAMRAFCDIFGGGPYSKLFENVREKLSLCYYCSARYEKRKSCILIQCGCEEENMDRAVEEILKQLEDIKNGNFKEGYEASKIGLSDSLRSANDEALTLNLWYLSQCCDKELLSPNDSADNNEKVSFDEIKECAGLLTLDTVYKLMSRKEE